MEIKGYAIRSISSEGVYYLVNGWNKYLQFWTDEKHIDRAIFTTIGHAKTQLTKLLKIMEEYSDDTFEYIAITTNGEFSVIPYTAL